MPQYTVHIDHGSDSDMVLVKEGFCWPAFFLSSVWALSCRMWLVAIGFFAVMTVSDFMMTALGLNSPIQWVILLGLGIGIGFVANDLRRWTLERRYWTMEGVVVASDLQSAERRFLENRPEIAAKLS